MYTIFILLSGCVNEINPFVDKRFVGTWKEQKEYGVGYTFFSDKSCIAGVGYEGTWDIKDGLLVINIELLQLSNSFSYTFSVNDTILTLTEVKDDSITVLHKS